MHHVFLRIRAVVMIAGLAVVTPAAAFAGTHPSLLFGSDNLSALRVRVNTPGAVADTYDFIRGIVVDEYATAAFDSLLAEGYGLAEITNIALAGHLENPVDIDALNLGKELTLYLSRTSAVDGEPWSTSLRLRSLAVGYDAFYGVATPEERAELRVEIESYLSFMTTSVSYDAWLHRPYVSNKSAMIAASLGLAAIAMSGETSPSLIAAAFTRADALYNAWLSAHLADDGCYREGTLYGAWSFRNLVYYFHARKRFDGTVYSGNWAIREFERWYAYELDPRGGARLNNLNDQSDYFLPLARHATYFEWASQEWGSSLSRYIVEHSVGSFGVEIGDDADKAATVLWRQNGPVANPSTVLPKSALWPSRGLYYYRSGWPTGSASDDLVFSFYSGEFRGGHAQEDQNQITLTAFGERLVVDHGAGSVAKQSEAHSIVRVDQAGQHNAGSSIGTDGRIAESMLTGFADYVCGDATDAYATHSPYNDPGVPYPSSDWSWGYSGSNPVDHARRRAVVVHGDGSPTYLIIQDDIEKDGAVHRYDWPLHVPDGATVTTTPSSAPFGVAVGNARMDVHVLFPQRSTLAGVQVLPFDNQSEDPNSKVLQLTSYAVNPKFASLLMPRRSSDPAPSVQSSTFAAGTIAVVGLQNATDIVFVRGNHIGPVAPLPPAAVPGGGGCNSLSVDAQLAVVRLHDGGVTSYLAVDAKSISCASGDIVTILDGTATVAFDGTRAYVDRPNVAFRILGAGVTEVWCNGVVVPTGWDGAYLVPVSATGVDAPPSGALRARAYPNPFNPSVRVAFTTRTRDVVDARIFDASGRFIVALVEGVLPAGEHVFQWDGRDRDGGAVASGVYFMRVRANDLEETVKLVLVR